MKMEGTFLFSFKPRDEQEQRTLLCFLRQFRTPESTAKRSFLRQSWLSEWYGVPQGLISRWEGYVRENGLQKLRPGATESWVLTAQIKSAILEIWVPNFWLSAAQVQERLVVGGHITSSEEVSVDNIYRTAKESGFSEVRRHLRQLFQLKADGPEWHGGVLTQRLLETNQTLLKRLEAGGGLTPQLLLDVEALKLAPNISLPLPKKALPYAYQWQQILFGQWQDVDDGITRCPHCGSGQVARKENKPRQKRYRDTQGDWQETEGYRYYCRNSHCEYGSFTDYPQGVRLHSGTTMMDVIWGVAVYMQLRTTYRRAATAVGMSHVTLWRHANEVGQHAMSTSALFGIVRCSGVVGVDEKWVLVPKNDKPDGKRKRWMYVYLAVDVHTYDLLHIDIFPYNGKDQARAFLQALKLKGSRLTLWTLLLRRILSAKLLNLAKI